MERETKTFKTSGGHELSIVTFATGRDFNAIQQVYLEGATVQMKGGAVEVDGFNAGADFKAKEKAIELFVKALDGKSEDVVNRVMELPYQEMQEIQTELEELTSKKKIAS